MQSGYPTGYLAASLVFGFLYALAGLARPVHGGHPSRVVPDLLYLEPGERIAGLESGTGARARPLFRCCKTHWRLALFAIVHDDGVQFLQPWHPGSLSHLPAKAASASITPPSRPSPSSTISRAILGGLTVGSLSQRFGRRRASVVTALLAVPVAFLWAFSTTAALLALGAFMMQFFVQGAWGVVPAHLNEISPRARAAPFPARSINWAISSPR